PYVGAEEQFDSGRDRRDHPETPYIGPPGPPVWRDGAGVSPARAPRSWAGRNVTPTYHLPLPGPFQRGGCNVAFCSARTMAQPAATTVPASTSAATILATIVSDIVSPH